MHYGAESLQITFLESVHKSVGTTKRIVRCCASSAHDGVFGDVAGKSCKAPKEPELWQTVEPQLLPIVFQVPLHQ